MKYREYGTEGEDIENRTKIKEHSTIQEILSLVFKVVRYRIWMHCCNLNDRFNGSTLCRRSKQSAYKKSKPNERR